jgi:hypothetical protein
MAEDRRSVEARPFPPIAEFVVAMPLHVYDDIYQSGSVPADWRPDRGGALKYPVRNKTLLAYLRQLIPGRWQKVIIYGSGGEVHYFEHASGKVADVKFFLRS